MGNTVTWDFTIPKPILEMEHWCRGGDITSNYEVKIKPRRVYMRILLDADKPPSEAAVEFAFCCALCNEVLDPTKQVSQDGGWTIPQEQEP